MATLWYETVNALAATDLDCKAENSVECNPENSVDPAYALDILDYPSTDSDAQLV